MSECKHREYRTKKLGEQGCWNILYYCCECGKCIGEWPLRNRAAGCGPIWYEEIEKAGEEMKYGDEVKVYENGELYSISIRTFYIGENNHMYFVSTGTMANSIDECGACHGFSKDRVTIKKVEEAWKAGEE